MKILKANVKLNSMPDIRYFRGQNFHMNELFARRSVRFVPLKPAHQESGLLGSRNTRTGQILNEVNISL